MLTSCKLTGIAETISAYHMSEENYYFAQANGVESLSGGEAAPSQVRVYGGLCKRLGFKEGESITEEAFTNLLSGKNKAGARVTREHKVHGIDLTFSAPKSVSLGALLTIRDPRLLEAHDLAVLETMREIERHCAGTQPRAGEHVKTGNLAYVAARDGFNRDHEPHLHTHVVAMNMTAYKGKVLAVDGKQIMTRDFNKMWGAMYRAKLAAHLKEQGYSISYTKKGEMRLDAVSLDLEREFSGRRAAIVAAKEGGKTRDIDAWRTTRKQKDPAVEKQDVQASWQARAARYAQKSTEENRRDAQLARDQWVREAKWSSEARQEAAGERPNTDAARWQLAAKRATERSACVSAAAVITEYLAERGRAEIWEKFTYAQAEHLLAAEVAAGRLLRTDDGRYTTWEMARADRECVAAARSTVALALPAEAARAQLQAYCDGQQRLGRRTLSDRQRAVAAGVLESSQAVVVVQGDAGSGKTTMLAAVREVASQVGWQVTGLAVQGVAARKLKDESGITTATLASYLGAERTTGAGQRTARLVVVDEASMLDSRGLADLLRLAEARGDKVVLVGDRNQLQSVGAGKPFERLAEEAEESGQLLSLSENFRQRNKDLRKAVDLARAGEMSESLELLDQTGRVCEIADDFVRRRAIAKLYSDETLILTGSRAGRDALNKEIRSRLKAKGALVHAKQFEVTWQDEDGIKYFSDRELAVGERITFLENEYDRYDVRNGDIGLITDFDGPHAKVRLEGGREIDLDVRSYGALEYGYCLTTYKCQGQTYSRVVVDADTSVPHLQDQRNCYVQVTRARDDVRIFTDDKASLLDAASIMSAKSDTLSIEKSLSQTQSMERLVHAEAFGCDAGPTQVSSKQAQIERHA